MMKWAGKARDHLVEDTSTREDAARSQLRAETTSTTTVITMLSSLVSRAARAAACSDAEMVELRNELKAALLSKDMMQRHRQRADREKPLWEWLYHVTDVLQQEDVMTYMGCMVNNHQGDVILPVTSLRELSETVHGWMNEMTETTNSLTSELAACKQKLTQCFEDVATIRNNEADLEKKTTSLSDDLTTMRMKETDLEKKTRSLSDYMTVLTEKEDELGIQMTSLDNDLIILKKREADLRRATASLSDKIG